MRYLISLYRQSFSNLQPNVWILSLSMFINRSGSMVLLFASLYLTNDLHFSLAEAGVMLSFYGIGSVLGSYAGGWLTDRRSFFDIMVYSLLASGAILLILPLVSSYLAVSTVIFCYAFASDIFRPANSKAIAAYSSPENRTRSVSLMRLAINLGFSLGPAAGGFIALHLGYKWLFVLDALTSFAAAGILLLYLPRQPKATAQHAGAGETAKSTSAYRDFPYLLFILLVALYGICFFQLFASIPQYFSQVCHYSEDTIGLLLALNGFLVVLIEMPVVLLLEKKTKIFPFIIAGTLCIPVAFLALMGGQGLISMAILYTLIITMSEILAMPFMMNHALSRPQKDRQGQYAALYSISYGIANIAAPSAGLWIAARYGFNDMFLFFIALSLVVAGGFAFLHRGRSKA